MRYRGLLFLFCLILLPFGPAAAQSWPSRPVQITVSSGAGGTADIVARMIGVKLAPALGQPVVIDNKPGAGGNLGASAVARANPDGYTLLIERKPHPFGGTSPVQEPELRSDARCSSIAMLAVAPNLLVVNASSPVRSVGDLIKLAREKPGTVTYSSAGIGTSGHLAAELLKATASVDMSHVPYKSGPEAVTGVLSENVTFIFFTLPSLLPQVETGKLRALAITSAERSKLMPDIPTVAEAGFPGFDVNAWYALFAPRGTPKSVVARLSAEIKTIVGRDDVRDQMARLGAEPRYLSPKEVADFVAVESPKWGALLKDINASAN